MQREGEGEKCNRASQQKDNNTPIKLLLLLIYLYNVAQNNYFSRQLRYKLPVISLYHRFAIGWAGWLAGCAVPALLLPTQLYLPACPRAAAEAAGTAEVEQKPKTEFTPLPPPHPNW